MKNFLKINLYTGFMALGFFILNQNQSWAQCSSQATVYTQSNTIPYCASGTCPTKSISIDMGSSCTGITTPFVMEAKGGILFAGGLTSVVPTRVGNVFTVNVVSNVDDLCKGRIVFKYTLTSDPPCNPGAGNYPVENVRYIDVYKSNIPTTALDQIYASNPSSNPLGGQFRIVTETPACITPGDVFNLSVYPIFQNARVNPTLNPPQRNCLTDGIGLDEINWDIPAGIGLVELNRAADGSSVTLQMPAPANNGLSTLPATSTFGVRIGKANTTAFTPTPVANATTVLRRGVRMAFITASGTGANGAFPLGLISINQGFQFPVATACIPINRGGIGNTTDRITLTCNPNEGTTATYKWTVPSVGFNVVGGSITSNQIVIEVENRNNETTEFGASGSISCEVTSSDPAACGSNVAFLRINRSLVVGYNTISLAAGSNQPGLGGGTSPAANCFNPSLAYTFQIDKAPFNTPFNWNNTQNTAVSYWNVQNNPLANQITLSPVAVGGVLNLPLNVSALPCSTNTATDVISYKIGTGNADPQIGGNPIANLEIDAFGQGLVRVGIRTNPGITPRTYNYNWYPIQTAAPVCTAGAADFTYTWTYDGTINGNPCTFPCSSIFSPSNTGNGLNAPTILSGNYTGTFKVSISTRQNWTATCNSANCFFASLSQTVTNQPLLRPGAPVGDPEMPVGNEPFMRLSPNPASQQVSISLENIGEGGEAKLISNMQIVVRRLPISKEGVMNLNGLAKGIYTLSYMSPEGKIVTRRLSIE